MPISGPIVIPTGMFIPSYFETGVGAIDENIEVYSLTNQTPTALDTPLQLQVDAPYVGDSFDVDTQGIFTMKKAGLFDVRLSMSLGRTSNSGDSFIIVRGELDPGGTTSQGWVQTTQARAFELDNNKAIVPVLFNAMFNIPSIGPVPPKVRAVIYRDSIGVNDGGLISVASTLYGATASLTMNITHAS